MTTFYGDAEKKRLSLERAARMRERLGTFCNDRRSLYFTTAEACDSKCSKTDCEHHFYSTELSLPATFAYTERGIYKELQDCRSWSERILNAMPVGIEEPLVEHAVQNFAARVLHNIVLPACHTHEQENVVVELVKLFRTHCIYPANWRQAAEAGTAANTGHKVSHIGSELDCRRYAGDFAAVSAHHFAKAIHDARSMSIAIECALAAAGYLQQAKQGYWESNTQRSEVYRVATLAADWLVEEITALTPVDPKKHWWSPIVHWLCHI